MKRVQQIVKVKPEKYEEYKKLHANIWEEAAKVIKEAHIQNYSISYRDGLLFAYFEYTGDNYEMDMCSLSSCGAAKRFKSRPVTLPSSMCSTALPHLSAPR